ncbi:hypothetical protein K1719_038106 [Acacia pycnantha]|nr:hypothetical protein K1719_038106 [Acacia pycnantha]
MFHSSPSVPSHPMHYDTAIPYIMIRTGSHMRLLSTAADDLPAQTSECSRVDGGKFLGEATPGYSNSRLTFFTPATSLLLLNRPLPTTFRIAITHSTKPLTLLRTTLMDPKRHCFNAQVKLTMAGNNIVKEENFALLTSDSIRDYDVSSISGSEEDDDDNKIETQRQNVRNKSSEGFRQKLFICLTTGERVSVWKCLIMNMGENILNANEVIERLKSLTLEPRNNSRLRIVLLASGRHFAGCVFDGDELVAHKTFHRKPRGSAMLSLEKEREIFGTQVSPSPCLPSFYHSWLSLCHFD